MRRILILGSTGSIGVQALDVVERSDELEVVGLAAARSWEPLLEQAAAHGVPRIALADEAAAARASEAWTGGDVLAGAEGLVDLITETDCELVLNGLVGSAGLGPTVAALGEGIDLALANKESLVIGGELVMALAEATGAAVIPVDSEHSALYQLVSGERPGHVDRLVLTASGGPFRGRTASELADVTAAEALAHPTWDMGPVITINSATLVNKGLEVIEAHLLFDVPYDAIDVVVHPQSLVHSMVEFADGSTIAQVSPPDMRLPISLGLSWPDRVPDAQAPMDWSAAHTMTFEPLDDDVFPAVRLAREAGTRGGTAPGVFNAANEEAVAAFLGGRIAFKSILGTVERVLGEHEAGNCATLDDVLAGEAWARRRARELVGASPAGVVGDMG
jgi:1-deoxy-D-xylulose-5-phosphate reductoisomerase